MTTALARSGSGWPVFTAKAWPPMRSRTGVWSVAP